MISKTCKSSFIFINSSQGLFQVRVGGGGKLGNPPRMGEMKKKEGKGRGGGVGGHGLKKMDCPLQTKIRIRTPPTTLSGRNTKK